MCRVALLATLFLAEDVTSEDTELVELAWSPL